MSMLSDIEKAREKKRRLDEARKRYAVLETLIPHNKKILESYRKKAQEYTELHDDMKERIKLEEEYILKLDKFLLANAHNDDDIEIANRLADRIEKLKKELEKKRKAITDAPTP